MIALKASLFEVFKRKFISDLQEDPNVISIKNAEGVKVSTLESGEAYVEYMMEIYFKAKSVQHGVKFTAYSTTCQLQIQSKGETAEPQPHLDNRSVSKYFSDKFFMAWYEESVNEGDGSLE